MIKKDFYWCRIYHPALFEYEDAAGCTQDDTTTIKLTACALICLWCHLFLLARLWLADGHSICSVSWLALLAQGGGLSEALQIMAGCPDNPVMSISECVMAAPAGLLMIAGKSTIPTFQRGWMCSYSSENVLKERKLTVSPHSNSGNQRVNFFRRINQLSPWQCAAQTEAPITWQQSCLQQDCSFSKIRCFMLL